MHDAVHAISGMANAASDLSARAAPPAAAAVVGADFAGFTVPALIQFFTLVWIILVVVHKAWHLWKEWKSGKESTEPEDEPL